MNTHTYTRSLYKKRNITKKSYTYFKNNLYKYLSLDEQVKIPAQNDLIKYTTYPIPPINLPCTIKIDKKRVNHLKKLIRSQYITKNGYKKDDHDIRVSDNKNEDYTRYFMKQHCKEYDILNVNILSKPFIYFNITPFETNPSKTHILFGVDFIGNRCYHLFIKSLYSNEIKEIIVGAQKVVPTKDLLGDENFSDNFTWINDDEIAYIGQNRYYNQNGAYVYNIITKHKYLFAKLPHGYFGNIDVTYDMYYIILTISDYNSDEIYILDNEDRLKIGKPILKRKFSVTYPFIDHNGEWIIHEKNKGIDILKKTKDFNTYQIDYINKNPTEQILKVQYVDDTYIFNLIHLKGCKIYTHACDKLTMHYDEPVGYINFHVLSMKQFTYRTSYFLTEEKESKHKCIHPDYYEKKIYIRKDLHFTILSKSKPHLSKCLMFGYGSYNFLELPHYTPHYKALILDGWTVVIAHLRGGGEYGYKGYNEGRLTNQKNTFLDFIETADYLVENKITTRKKLAIWGRSAGGLLITNVLNMRPDICELAIIGVPFISPVKTLITYKTPLGIESRSEFGNPNTQKDKIKEYDPLYHIDLDKAYPNIFIYSNYYDTLVPYTEPLLYYNTMKHAKVFQHDKEINLFIDNKYGHTQGSSKESASHAYSIIFDQLYRYVV